MAKELSPAQQLETFLKFIDLCASRYNFAYGNVALEDKRLRQIYGAARCGVFKPSRHSPLNTPYS